jgi:hypothetical protein
MNRPGNAPIDGRAKFPLAYPWLVPVEITQNVQFFFSFFFI